MPNMRCGLAAGCTAKAGRIASSKGKLNPPEIGLLYYDSAVVLAKKKGYTDLEILALNRKAIALRKTSDFVLARELHETALKAANEHDSLRAYVFNSLAITLISALDYQGAKEALQSANFLNLKNDWKASAAAVYNNLGVIAEKQANYGEGLYHYEKALDLREITGNDIERARVLKNIGIIFNKLGQYDQSTKYLIEAIELLKISPTARKNEQA